MVYEMELPPPGPKFAEMSKAERSGFRDWFLGAVARRVPVLERAVRSTDGFTSWRADRRPESLVALGAWLRKKARRRRIGERELEDERRRLPFPADLPDHELTDQTIGMAMDIEMYLGEVVIANVPGTRWEQILKQKRHVDFGRVVVMGIGDVPLNPVRVVVVVAYELVEGQGSVTSLKDVYDRRTAAAR